MCFDQPFTEITFSRALLDAPSPHTDPVMQHTLQSLAEQRLLQQGHAAPCSWRLRQLLLECGAARISMGKAARTLGLSERSLRSALTAEGTSYRDIERAVLGTVAKRLLSDPARTVQEVAFALGFSDATTFHRAFKRWTGVTPSEFRRRPG